MQAHRILLAVLFTGLLSSPFPLLADASDVIVESSTLVSAKRIGRTVFDYNYQITAKNQGTENLQAVTAVVTLQPDAQGMTVMEGDLSFGDMAAGESVQGDTWTLRMNRRFAFNPGALIFTFSVPTVDSTPPDVIATLAADFDNAPTGDDSTVFEVVTLFGLTEPNLPVTLFTANDLVTPIASTVASADGSCAFTLVRLALGANTFVMQATDAAGNQGSSTKTITRLPCHSDIFSHAFLVNGIDVPVQGSDTSRFIPDTPGFIGEFSEFLIAGAGKVEVVAGFIDNNLLPDTIATSQADNQILVYLNDGSGTLGAPAVYPSGAVGPVSIAVGNFIGDINADVAVGHIDGSVMFLEGLGNGALALNASAGIPGLGGIKKLSAADLDDDGDLDLAVSAGTQVNLLLNDNDILNVEQLVNGKFSQGLTGWQVSAAGHRNGDQPGSINAAGGSARITENGSFRTTLQQTFTLEAAQPTISFDILFLGLDIPGAGIPDAFEVSLLNGANASVVATINPNATAFLNVNPGTPPSLAAGVSFDGTHVVVDVSTVSPGLPVTLYFDLIGSPPGNASVVNIDNVDAGTGTVLANTFTLAPLPGLFTDTEGISHCEVNGDGLLDIIVADPGAGQLIVYEGTMTGSFVRAQEIPAWNP